MWLPYIKVYNRDLPVLIRQFICIYSVIEHLYYSSVVLIWMANLFLGTTSRILNHVVFFSSKSDCLARFIAFTTPCTSYSFQRLHKIDKIWRRKRSVTACSCCCLYCYDAVRRKSGSDRAGHGSEITFCIILF